MENNTLVPFEGKEIRKVWHEEQWYFSAIDVISILTDSKDSNQYWKKLKKRDPEMLSGVQIVPLSIGNRKLLCSNTEGIFRMVMSIPSPKAEPLKLWLAQAGKEKMEETENPELSIERARELYKAKGYSDLWIERRMQTIETRNELTAEWKKRGVKDGQEYSILTATIAKGTFGLTPKEHKEIKGLAKPSQNLRDHMTPLELIFTALGEELTRSEAVRIEAQGFNENQDAAAIGGRRAGDARRAVEKTGETVISNQNYLNLSEQEPLKENSQQGFLPFQDDKSE
jgi:DNA-damage-inducible protein D